MDTLSGIVPYIFTIWIQMNKKGTTDKDLISLTVQGENPLYSDRRYSGGGEAVMWCRPSHPVKVKNTLKPVHPCWVTTSISFNSNVLWSEFTHTQLMLGLHAEQRVNVFYAFLFPVLVVYMKRKSCLTFHLTPFTPASASLLAAPLAPHHRTLLVGPPACQSQIFGVHCL